MAITDLSINTSMHLLGWYHFEVPPCSTIESVDIATRGFGILTPWDEALTFEVLPSGSI